MDNETLGGCIGAIIGIIVIIAIAAFFMSISQTRSRVGKLSPALSLGIAILCASLFKGTSYKN